MAIVIAPSHNMHSFGIANIHCSFRPTKTVEQADGLMGQAQLLYEKYKHIINPIDRTVVEGKMAL